MNTLVPKSILIVGGGASATLLLAQLSIQLNGHSFHPINIYIVDNSQAFKVGIAYNIEHPSFVLNVAANRMGAYADQCENFYKWLTNYPALWRNLHSDFHSIEFKASDFIPRMIYGAYLRWVFDQALALAATKNISIHRLVARVTNIQSIKETEQLQVIIDTQESLIVDTVILATGNAHQNHQGLISSHIFTSPYGAQFLQHDWSQVKDVILLGSGLSMVDAVQYLAEQNFQGKYHVFSRHGLTPLPHLVDNHFQEAPPLLTNDLNSAKKIVASLRAQIATNAQEGITWQASINAIRPHTNNLWASLTDKERQKLRKSLPWWNVVRHRIPLYAYKNLHSLKQAGRLAINKGDVIKAEGDGEYFVLKLSQKTLFIKAEKMVSCSGYRYGYDHLFNILGKLVKPRHDLQKDLAAGCFQLSEAFSIYALGPSLAGILFETTSIYDIRQQALDIATTIKNDLKI